MDATINLTPHEVRVRGLNYPKDGLLGGDVVYPPHPSGPARAVGGGGGGGVKDERYPYGWTEEGAVVYGPPAYTAIAGLPPPEANVRAIIVSTIVAELLRKPEFAHLYRGTVLVPDSNPGSVVRDAQGHIVAVSGLLHYGGPAVRDSTGYLEGTPNPVHARSAAADAAFRAAHPGVVLHDLVRDPNK
jgi:hypothetical protein